MNPIRNLRSQMGVTQTMLALVAKTSQPTIAAYESGEKSPTLGTLEKLARSLGLEVAIIFVPLMTNEDARSLAYHQAIVGKFKNNTSAVLTKAKQNLAFMLKKNPDAEGLLHLWKNWLELPINNLVYCCLDMSPLGRDMRQVTPFAGILSAKERFAVIQKWRADINPKKLKERLKKVKNQSSKKLTVVQSWIK